MENTGFTHIPTPLRLRLKSEASSTTFWYQIWGHDKNLAKAKQRTMRVYYEDIGWVWEADQEALQEAQKALDDFHTDEAVREIDKQIDAWNEYKDPWGGTAEAFELEQEKLIAQQLLGKNIEADILKQRTNQINKFKDNYLDVLKKLADASADLDYSDVSKTSKASTNKASSSSSSSSNSSTSSSSGTQTITIKSGDTLGALAKKYNTTVDNLLKLNSYITDKNKIYAGKKLVVPKLAIGTTFVPNSGLYNVDELSEELIVRNPDKGRYTFLEKGDGVVPHNLTERLMNIASTNPFANAIDGLLRNSELSKTSVDNSTTNSGSSIYISKVEIRDPNVDSVEKLIQDIQLIAQNR